MCIRDRTDTDNILFTTMTHNPARLHLDEEYMKNETEFGGIIVNSMFTLSLMIGVTVYDTTLGTTVANLGMDEIKFPNPVFPGDTLHVQTEILEKRDSKSRPTNGIVLFQHRAYNQKNDLVATCNRSGLMLRKPA